MDSKSEPITLSLLIELEHNRRPADLIEHMCSRLLNCVPRRMHCFRTDSIQKPTAQRVANITGNRMSALFFYMQIIIFDAGRSTSLLLEARLVRARATAHAAYWFLLVQPRRHRLRMTPTPPRRPMEIRFCNVQELDHHVAAKIISESANPCLAYIPWTLDKACVASVRSVVVGGGGKIVKFLFQGNGR